MKRSGFTMMVVFLGVIGSLYVWMQIDLLRVGSEIERLKDQRVELKHRQEVLQLQLSQLTAPQKIAQAARQLNLEMPQPGQIVMVTSDTAMAMKTSRPKNTVQLAQRVNAKPLGKIQ